MCATSLMALIISTSTCASATPRCSLQPSSARRSLQQGSPSTIGLVRGGGGGGQRVGVGDWLTIRHIRRSRGQTKSERAVWWDSDIEFSPSATCRSKRKGYLHYAMGQLRQMGKQFYDTDIHVEVLSEQMVGDYSHVTMRYTRTHEKLFLYIYSSTARVFPFCAP